MKTMKEVPGYFLLVVLFAFLANTAMTQCIPLGPDECPDPENNGEICPDTMPDGYLNVVYSEEATILVPEEYLPGVFLHHITLAAIDNLPTGISWESNAVNNEFLAGNYYCIVLAGTPTEVDVFHLKIVVDVYIDLNGQAVYYGQIIDSTSLAMIIREDFGVKDPIDYITIDGSFPNPFSDLTSIRFESKQGGKVQFEVYSLLGEKIHMQDVNSRPGENTIIFRGDMLPAGAYCYVLRNNNFSVSRIFIRKD